MTRGVISVTPDTDLEEVSHLLVHERVRRLPVLDQGRPVGIISRADLVSSRSLKRCTLLVAVLGSDSTK